MTHDTDDILAEIARNRIVHPRGHCTRCGESLRFVPCLNCGHPNTDAEVTDE